MKKLLFRLGLGLVVLILLVVGITYALPRHVTVERSTVIGRSAPLLYTMLASNRSYRLWAPWWPEKGVTAFTYEAADYGAGARLLWQTGKTSGYRTVTTVESGKAVREALSFGGHGEVEGEYTLSRNKSGGTRVAWRIRIDTRFDIIQRWRGLMADREIGPPMDAALLKLKTLAEIIPDADINDLDMQVVTVAARTVAAVSLPPAVTLAEDELALTEALTRVNAYLSERGLYPEDAQYKIDVDANTPAELSLAGFAIPDGIILPEGSGIGAVRTYSGPALMIRINGGGDAVRRMRLRVGSFIQAANMTQVAPSWEVRRAGAAEIYIPVSGTPQPKR